MSFNEEWREINLSDIAEIIMGQSPKGNTCNKVGKGVPLLNGPTEFGDHYPEELQYTVDPKKFAEKGDILFCVRGSTTGRMNWADKKYAIGRGLAAIRSKNNYKLNTFIKMIIEYKLPKLLKMATGSTFPNVTKSMLYDLEIKVPTKKEQEKLSNIFLSIDNKIKLNNNMNRILEKIAQAIYKNWFIDFEPFQDEEFVESELGMIPKSWKIGYLGDKNLASIVRGSIDEFGGEKIYLATADVNDTKITSYDTKITYESKPSRANRKPEKNTVWFAKMKDSRKLILVDDYHKFLINDVILSTGFAGLEVEEYALYYIWNFIFNNSFERVKDNLCTGTTMEAINNKNIKNINILIPPKEILIKFNAIVKPLYKKVYTNKQEYRLLSNIRDTLLPKLMSGEIRVESFEKERG